MPTAELNKALAAFQAELPKIPKDATGEIRGTTKDGKPYSYSFDYASLEGVSDETMPALGRHGLALTGAVTTDDQGRIVYEYTLLHESGDERGPYQFPLWLLLPDRYTAQTIGGYISYARRYIIGPVTGIAPGGQDIDATGAEEAARPPQRVKTAHTDPEHQRLQPRRTPDDRPAERGPVPPADDLWRDQPAGQLAEPYEPEKRTGSIDGRQRSQIFAKFKILSVPDPGTQRSILTQILGREVSSRATLSAIEADTVLKDLQARVDAKEAAEEAARVAAEQDAAAEGVTKLAEHRGKAGAS